MPQTIDEIKTRVKQIISSQSTVKSTYKDIADLYWMDNSPSINTKVYDKDDIRYTKSTSARDRVSGLHRMLRTTEPKFKVECDSEEVAGKMEDAAEAWWKASCERKRAAVHSDLALSAILFSDANLEVTSVQDLLNIQGISPVRKKRLENYLTRAPLIFEVGSAFFTYPVWGDDGLSEYLRQYKIKGKALRERYGVSEVKDDQDYTINDYYDLEVRCVYTEDLPKPLIGPDAYDLPDIPCFSAVADGTDVFVEEERKRQPFLYGWVKSGMYQREDELLTTLFTSTYARGTGALAILDPDSVQNGVTVNYAGLLRYIIAKGTFADDKAFDANLIQLLNKLNEMGQTTTINNQTLGENIESGTPYSGYAMASQNGRIPLVPIQEAVQKVIKDAMTFAFRYYKQGGMKWKDLSAAEIPDDFKLTVKLEVDLPQDQFKMAQVAAQLSTTGYVSAEWVRNLLQIHDSKKMDFDILSEKAMITAFELDKQNLVAQMLQMANQSAGSTPTSTLPADNPNGPPTLPPNAPPNKPFIPGGPQAAAAGGEALPATEPMTPTVA